MNLKTYALSHSLSQINRIVNTQRTIARYEMRVLLFWIILLVNSKNRVQKSNNNNKEHTLYLCLYVFFSLSPSLSVLIPISVFEYASTKTEYTDSEHNKDCIGKNVQVKHRCTLFILFSSPVLLHLPLFTYSSARLYLVAVCRCSFFSFRRIWMLFCGIVETLSNRRNSVCVCMFSFTFTF